MNLQTETENKFSPVDLWLSGEKILKITKPDEITGNKLIGETVDCGGLFALPGLIDQHVHITGAGGERGFASRTPEITANEIFSAGVTTVVGLLGADGCTRSPENLYAKAKALESEGVTTYLYSGSYSLPPVTLTGDILRDILLIDKVLGAGEIAIADHRSSQPDERKLLELASQVHLGGLLSGKAGVLHLHVGDAPPGIAMLPVLSASGLPMEMFVPTHLNRSRELLSQAVQYGLKGGRIDFTAGEKAGAPVPQAVRTVLGAGVDKTLITVSSDAHGSSPDGGVACIDSLFRDITGCIAEGIAPETAFSLCTINVARLLKLYPHKGVLAEGSDADILLLDKNYKIKKVFSMGKLVFEAR